MAKFEEGDEDAWTCGSHVTVSHLVSKAGSLTGFEIPSRGLVMVMGRFIFELRAWT